MKAVTIFQAEDGTRFNSSDACQRYESLCAEITIAMMPVGAQPQNLPAWGFLQHSESAYRAACRSMNRILQKIYTDIEPDNILIHYGSYTARVVSESDKPCLTRAYERLCRISADTFREYNQMYYVANEQKHLNGNPEYQR